MTCRDGIPRMIECARSGAAPDPDLRSHLASCPACDERFESERNLSAQFKALRIGAVREARRRQRPALLVPAMTNHPRNPWRWAAAAAVVIGLAGAGAWHRGWAPNPNGIVGQADTGDDFVPVPYTPPLAPGEFVRVVQVDLPAEEVAEMGFDLAGSAPRMVPVDLMLGQDDVPRALRILNDVSEKE